MWPTSRAKCLPDPQQQQPVHGVCGSFSSFSLFSTYVLHLLHVSKIKKILVLLVMSCRYSWLFRRRSVKPETASSCLRMLFLVRNSGGTPCHIPGRRTPVLRAASAPFPVVRNTNRQKEDSKKSLRLKACVRTSEVRMELSCSLAVPGRMARLTQIVSFLPTSDVLTHSFILILIVNPLIFVSILTSSLINQQS